MTEFSRVPAQTPQYALGLSSATRSSPRCSAEQQQDLCRLEVQHCWNPLQNCVVFLCLALRRATRTLDGPRACPRRRRPGGRLGGPGYPSTHGLLGPLFELPPRELQNPLGLLKISVIPQRQAVVGCPTFPVSL